MAEIVPLTPAEDAELCAESAVGELGLCGPEGNVGACPPRCCKGVMTREEAKADAERSIGLASEGLVKDEPIRLSVELTEEGWAPRLADMMGFEVSEMSILMEAEKITNGRRQADYGTALDNHERIARYWNTFLRNRINEGDLEPEEIAMMMILMKVARIQNKIDRDGLVDISGYANVISKMGPQRAERASKLADEL